MKTTKFVITGFLGKEPFEVVMEVETPRFGKFDASRLRAHIRNYIYDKFSKYNLEITINKARRIEE